MFKHYSYVFAATVLNLFISSMSNAMEAEVTFDDSIFLTRPQHCIDYRKIIKADGPHDKRGEGVKVAIIESRWFDPEGDTKSALTQTTKDRLIHNNPPRNQADGHINCVASIIAGTNGIAPQSELEIIHYTTTTIVFENIEIESPADYKNPNSAIRKALDAKDDYASLVAAIRQAIDAKVDFINLSIGFGSVGSNFPQALHQPLLEARDAGIGIVLAAGNQDNLGRFGVVLGNNQFKGFADFLGKMQGHMRIAVSTSYEKNEKTGKIEEIKSGFSNRVDWQVAQYTYAAPGDRIRSYGINSVPQIMSGTSFSTPMVVGAAALLKSNFQHLTNVQILDILAQTTRKKDPINIFGQGVLDISAAFERAATY